MAFEILDPNELLKDGLFFEDAFIAAVENVNWDSYTGKKVLVRGCTSSIIPPWAFMLLTGKLSEKAQSIRFGNEHDHVVVFRRKK